METVSPPRHGPRDSRLATAAAGGVWQFFRCPSTGARLEALSADQWIGSGATVAYARTGAVFDFDRPIAPRMEASPKQPPVNADPCPRGIDNAPELRAHHDRAFTRVVESTEEIYGPFDELPKLTQGAHFRRIEILDALPIRLREDSFAVDFGVGPWGFACIFPKLQRARWRVGFDVSVSALQVSAEKDGSDTGTTAFATSDGDAIPLVDECVDVFFGGEVIEHVREPRLFLQEIARVTKDGADVVLTTPNRDALLYKLDGQSCTIGTEHIALLSYADLIERAKRFFEVVSCHGYELTLSPELDRLIDDDATIRELQLRSYDFPALASGLILHLRTSKALYSANRKCWTRSEFLWSAGEVTARGVTRPLPLFGEIEGLLLEPASELTFAIEGDHIILLFWAHTWSGFARVLVNGIEHLVNLFSKQGGFSRIEIAGNVAGANEVRISRTDRRDPRSVADQVIFYKAIGFRRVD